MTEPKPTKERIVQNGLDIANSLGVRADFLVETVLDSSVTFAHTAFVHHLNANGFAEAAQALDDLWYARDEQWWREPDGYDGRYKYGDEKRQELFGEE